MISAERLEELAAVSQWESFGALALGRTRPYPPATEEENREILAHWRNMYGSSCYYDAILALLRVAKEK